MKQPVRLLTLVMCVVSAGTLAATSLQLAFPLLVCIGAGIGAMDRIRLNFSKPMESRLALGVAFVFALRWMLLPPPQFGTARVRFVAVGILDYAQAYPIAQALLVWMVLLLFLRREGGLPRTLPLYPALVLVLAGTMPPRAVGEWSRTAYQTGALMLTFAAGAYFVLYGAVRHNTNQPRNRARRNAYVVLFAVVLLFGWGLGQLVYSRGTDLDIMLANLVRVRNFPNAVGFSGEGRLDRITGFKSTNSDEIALTVTSSSTPGYLRGRAFDTFDGERWASKAASETVRPIARKIGQDNAQWFPLVKTEADLNSDQMTVEPSRSLRGAVFTQLESARVSADLDELSIDAHRIVAASQIPPAAPYRVAGANEHDEPLDPAERKILTAVPENIDPRIRALAEEITRSCAGDEERIQAVTAFLAATCSYSVNQPATVSDDPVAAFLFESHAGHCEFFATAATLLLRCAGVPCRYVTGFVAAEQNAYGGFWVARNKDAHAWVEAYLDGEGWTTVEATPASGVPAAERSRVTQLWDYAAHGAKGIVASIQNINARALAEAARALLVRYWPHCVSTLVIGALVVYLGRHLARYRKGRGSRASDPLMLSMQRSLQAMDRKAARAGFVRAGSETIDRFADRVEASAFVDLAAWYRTYSRARYGGSAEAVAFVSESLRVP